MIDRFNETLKMLLTRNDGSYTKLAESLDNVVTRSHLSQIINGKRLNTEKAKPPFKLIEKIREKYGIDPMTGEAIATNVTQGTPSTLSIREDVWQELRRTNIDYSSKLDDAYNKIHGMNQQLVGIIEKLLHSGIMPKQV